MTSLLAILLILATAVACAGLLRWAGAPGWSILGGIMAGLLLGPTILGRVAPDVHEQLFMGGQAERRERDGLARRHGAERLVIAPHLGKSTEEIQHDEIGRTAEMEAAMDRLRAARQHEQRPLRVLTIVLAFVALLPAIARPPTANAGRGSTEWLSIGLWSFTLPGAAACFACHFLFDCTLSQSLAVAAALAIGPALANERTLIVIDEHEPGSARTIILAGMIASAGAAGLLIASQLIETFNLITLLTLAPLLALPVRLFMPRAKPSAAPVSPDGKETSSAGSASTFTPMPRPAITQWLVLPGLAALSAVRIDLLEHTRLWPMVVILLLSDDGRWLGSFAGTLLAGGRTVLSAMRLAVPAVAAAPTQLALTAVLASGWLLPETVAWPLLLGVALIESTYGIRTRMLARLDALDRELQMHDRGDST